MADQKQKLTYTEAEDIARTRPSIQKIIADGCERAVDEFGKTGITQTYLGGLIGVAQNTISGWGMRDLIPYIKERHEKLLEIFGPDSLYAQYDPEKVLATEYRDNGRMTVYSDDSKQFMRHITEDPLGRPKLDPPTSFAYVDTAATSVAVSGASASGQVGKPSAQQRSAALAQRRALSETLAQFQEYCEINKLEMTDRFTVKNVNGEPEVRQHHIVTDEFVVDYAPVYVSRPPNKKPHLITNMFVNRGLKLAASRQLWLKEHPESEREFWLCYVLDDDHIFFSQFHTGLDSQRHDIQALNVLVIGGSDPADLFENWLMSKHPEDFAAFEDQLQQWPEDEDLDPV